MSIERLGGVLQTPAAPAVPGSGASQDGGAGFGRALAGLVGQVDASNAEANRAVASMLDGSGEVHDAMIALQRADLTLQFTVQVRNKLVQAYQEIMRMPV